MTIAHRLYDSFERKVLIGNSKLQWLYESLYRFSLRGMNYDQVQSVEESGELFVINYLSKKLLNKRGNVMMDVGANVGDYSKVLSTSFPETNVYSFEALPATFHILKENLTNYKNIMCENMALGDKIEERTFFSDGAGSHLSSFYPTESMHNERLKKNIIPITTIDSFCREKEIEKIDFLKIDVEGFELEVLKGAESMIKEGKILNIQFEFGGNHVTSGTHFYTIFKYLSQYRISRVLKNGLRPYTNYDKLYEVYSSANYLAELV